MKPTLMMLSLILSLFGCGPKKEVTETSLGPFVIRKTGTHGKTWDMNYGRVDSYDEKYRIFYEGKEIHPGGPVESNTGLPGIWRVYYLKDAPVPALIAGSQSLYLMTIEDGKPVSKNLFSQSSDFASVQWLDSDNGQPGIFREVFSTDTYDTTLVLEGGRFLAITKSIVLDVQTLQTYPFQTDHHLVEDFYSDNYKAVAFSPDQRQLVYTGSKNQASNHMWFQYALLCYDFIHQKEYAVPFDRLALHLKQPDRINPEWISDYFEWKTQLDQSLRLQLKENSSAVPRKGVLLYQRFNGYTFILDPVKKEMADSVFHILNDTLKPDAASVRRSEDEYRVTYEFTHDGINLVLQFGEYDQYLEIKEAESPTDRIKNENVMKAVEAAINGPLRSGRLQDLFVPVKEDY